MGALTDLAGLSGNSPVVLGTSGGSDDLWQSLGKAGRLHGVGGGGTRIGAFEGVVMIIVRHFSNSWK